MNGKKLHVMSDKEVEEFVQRLIAAGKNGEVPKEDIKSSEDIDMTSEFVVTMLKRGNK